MKKEGIIKRIENLELHHKIFAFILIMILTIVLIRISVSIKNLNPVLFNLEMHHFDYGLLLLVVTCLLLLFAVRKYAIYLPLAAIAIGTIVDDYWFIRTNFNEPGNLEEILIYTSTFSKVLILVIIIVLIIFVINSFRKKRT